MEQWTYACFYNIQRWHQTNNESVIKNSEIVMKQEKHTYIDSQTKETQSHVTSVFDPLFSVIGYSNGNKS